MQLDVVQFFAIYNSCRHGGAHRASFLVVENNLPSYRIDRSIWNFCTVFAEMADVPVWWRDLARELDDDIEINPGSVCAFQE